MVEFTVNLTPRAYRDLEGIFEYIAENLKDEDTANNIIDILTKSVLDLKQMPGRGAVRKTGIFAKKGYRQIFIKNYTIVYRIEEMEKRVIVVTIKYTPSNF